MNIGSIIAKNNHSQFFTLKIHHKMQSSFFCKSFLACAAVSEKNVNCLLNRVKFQVKPDFVMFTELFFISNSIEQCQFKILTDSINSSSTFKQRIFLENVFFDLITSCYFALKIMANLFCFSQLFYRSHGKVNPDFLTFPE